MGRDGLGSKSGVYVSAHPPQRWRQDSPKGPPGSVDTLSTIHIYTHTTFLM